MRNHRSSAALLLAGIVFVAGAAWAERGSDANRQSKNGELQGSIDGVAITVEYGRPNVKDRKIWGGLVPWDLVWRTGADEATTISFDRDVRIEGETLPAGRYALFTIPSMESWTLIFNNVADQWGAFDYDETEDALRVNVTPVARDHAETLTFAIEGDQVVLHWEKAAVGFGVDADG